MLFQTTMKKSNTKWTHDSKWTCVEEPQEGALRRSQRERKPTILNYYVLYLHEIETDLSIIVDDLNPCSQAVSYDNFDKW